MKRLLLGLCLASLTIVTTGCCCWQGSGGWTPCPWPGCGWGPGCGWNGGGCGWGGWSGWGCNRPGGCGEVYWGDWCTGDPHCSTCDGCGNWVGPPSPGGNGAPPEFYSRAHPYGNQVVNGAGSRRMPQQRQPQMARRSSPPPEYSQQFARRGNSGQYYGGRPPMAQRGQPQEYEGAIQYLGTTDRLVKPAAIAKNRSPNSGAVARRSEPTLADPDQEEDARPQVRRTSQGQYLR